VIQAVHDIPQLGMPSLDPLSTVGFVSCLFAVVAAQDVSNLATFRSSNTRDYFVWGTVKGLSGWDDGTSVADYTPFGTEHSDGCTHELPLLPTYTYDPTLVRDNAYITTAEGGISNKFQWQLTCCDNGRSGFGMNATVALKCEAGSTTWDEDTDSSWQFRFARRRTYSDDNEYVSCDITPEEGLVGYHLTLAVVEHSDSTNTWRGVELCYATPIYQSTLTDAGEDQADMSSNPIYPHITLTNILDCNLLEKVQAEGSGTTLEESDEHGGRQGLVERLRTCPI